MTNERCIFNYRLSRARTVVEIAFGILANQWRIFHRHIHLNPNNVTTVVKATVLLHNILTMPADKVYTEVIDRGKIFDDTFQDLANVGSQPATAANDVRNYFTEYFNSVAGSVEWQNDYAHVHLVYNLLNNYECIIVSEIN